MPGLTSSGPRISRAAVLLVGMEGRAVGPEGAQP
jgi:hypothetical protein